MSSEGRPLLSIVADTCGRHDTLGGACSAESNQVRYALDKKHMHNCRDSFLLALARKGWGMTKRDLPANINFFMNVPVTPAGALSFADGVSAPGRYVEMQAAMDVLALISNCPQLNNPCNAYNPTPVRLLVWPRETSAFAATRCPSSRRSWSPTAAPSRCGSCAPCAGSGSDRWRSTRTPMPPRRTCSAADEAVRLGGPAPRRELPARRRHRGGGARTRRGGDSPGLRLPGGERRLRRGLRGGGDRLHRSDRRADAGLRSQAHGAGAGRRRAAFRCSPAPGCSAARARRSRRPRRSATR